MKKLALALALTLALAPQLVLAQTVTTPAPVVIACAVNSTLPVPVIGQFYYVQCNPSGQVIVSPPSMMADPCANPSVAKNSVVIALTTTATTQLVTEVVGKVVYVCGFVATVAPSATTADNFLFNAGTGGTCGTGTVVLTGSFNSGNTNATVATTVVSYGIGGTAFSTASGLGLCIATSGTTVNIQGLLTYVQQ
ncbi:MAG: hypothetical protein ACREHG_03480 [Candidatus Saccharimonadales bacterium]